MSEKDFAATFEALKGILHPLEAHLVKVHDAPDHYYLDTPHVQENRKPLFFGAVRAGRRYVSFHLMPVYVWPELLDGVSERLRRRMQGKSCFNLTAPDPELVSELESLTRQGYERYRDAGFVA